MQRMARSASTAAATAEAAAAEDAAWRTGRRALQRPSARRFGSHRGFPRGAATVAAAAAAFGGAPRRRAAAAVEAAVGRLWNRNRPAHYGWLRSLLEEIAGGRAGGA